MFCSTIESLFDEPANVEIFPPNAYIHLLYSVSVLLLTEVVYVITREYLLPLIGR